MKPDKNNKSKRVPKQARTWEVDEFRLEIGNKLTNLQPWKRGEPILIEEPHTHFYRTMDRFGKPCFRSTINCGHYHEIEVGVDKNGDPVVTKVGPPLYQKTTIHDGETQTNWEPKQYYRKNDRRTFEDKHVHRPTYQGYYEQSELSMLQKAKESQESILKHVKFEKPTPLSGAENNKKVSETGNTNSKDSGNQNEEAETKGQD